MTHLMKLNVVINRHMKWIFVTFVPSCILLLAGCMRAANNVELELNHTNYPVIFTCSSIERGHSYLKRIFDVTGDGSYINEKNITFYGEGAFHGLYNNDGEIELWLYCHPRCYPIQATISWRNKKGVKYTKTFTLSDDDFGVNLAIYDDIKMNPTFVYMIHLKADGTIDIQKWQNFTLHGENFANDMQFYSIRP